MVSSILKKISIFIVAKGLKESTEIEIQNTEGVSVLEALTSKKIEIDHSCDGNGTCGTCLIDVENFVEMPRNEIEQEMASDRGFKSNERLACQIEAKDGMRIRILNK